MKVGDNYSEDNLAADRALIVYSSHMGKTLCTLNEIEDGVIQPGVPVDASKLAELFKAVGRGEQPKDGKMIWQSSNILARGPNAVMWYAPPAVREIYFSCENPRLMKCSGKNFPWPGLVFLVRSGKLFAFAVKSRPTPETKLYRAPFWNINSSTGAVCMPHQANKKTEMTPEEWEQLFFRSAFSHPGFGEACVRTGFAKLVPALIRSGAEKFPGAELVPSLVTMKHLLEGKR